MRKTFSLAPLLLLLMTTPAHANLWGKALIGCPPAVHAQVDPLVAPGPPGTPSGHDHGSAGSLAFQSDMTTGKMLSAGTTCFLKGDHVAAWAPTVINNGVSYPGSFSYYLAAAGADPANITGGKVQGFPLGLRFLMGNPESTVNQSNSFVRWRCGSQSTVLSTMPTAAQCATGFAMELSGPVCWDGMNLDSADHKSHVSGAGVGNGCPASHPVRIPQIQGAWSYPAVATGGRLSSDHVGAPAGSSAHMDYWAVFVEAIQDQLLRCINDPARNFSTAPLCGIFTYDGPPNPPNAWQPSLIAWSNTIGYVNSTGFAGAMPPVTP